MHSDPTCPRCGGAFDGHGLCAWCGQGVRYAGRGFAATDTDLRCPACEGDRPLWRITFHDVQIEVCPDCVGAWFDLGELEQLAQSARSAAKEGRYEPTRVDRPEEAPPRARAYIRCPRCDGLMNRENWERRSGVLVDVCRADGIWLDGGELSRVRTWSAGTPEGPPRDVAERAEPARQPQFIEPSWMDPSARRGHRPAERVFGLLANLFRPLG